MHNFIIKQIEKVITGIKKTQSDEQEDSFIYYRQHVFDVSFAKSQSILLIVTDLIEFLDKTEDKEKHRNLGYSWNKCKQASDLIQLTERNGKEDSFINYYKHKLDIDIEKVLDLLKLAIKGINEK
jgi:capsule polysaccharide export protein KpsE/RkpR